MCDTWIHFELSVQATKILVTCYMTWINISRQQNGTSAEEDNYNADIDGEGNYKSFKHEKLNIH